MCGRNNLCFFEYVTYNGTDMSDMSVIVIDFLQDQKICGQAGRGFLSLPQTQVVFLIGMVWHFFLIHNHALINIIVNEIINK